MESQFDLMTSEELEQCEGGGLIFMACLLAAEIVSVAFLAGACNGKNSK